LALDGRHLFPQDRFALALVERGLGLLTNLVGEAQHLEALGQELRDLFHPFRDVDCLKDLLLLLRFDVEVRRRHVRQRRRRRQRLEGGKQFRRRLRQELDRFDGLALKVEEARLDLRRR
jgi:hypothetical protein